MLRLRSTELTWQELDGHTVILDLKASVYLEINAAGTVLFPLIVAGTEMPELVSALVERYGLDHAAATTDVEAFLGLLRRRNLLDA